MMEKELYWAVVVLVSVYGAERSISLIREILSSRFLKIWRSRKDSENNKYWMKEAVVRVLRNLDLVDTALRNDELEEAKEEFTAAVKRIKEM